MMSSSILRVYAGRIESQRQKEEEPGTALPLFGALAKEMFLACAYPNVTHSPIHRESNVAGRSLPLCPVARVERFFASFLPAPAYTP